VARGGAPGRGRPAAPIVICSRATDSESPCPHRAIASISVTLAKPTPSVLDAIRQAWAVVSSLPESEEARQLGDQCLAYQHMAERWTQEAPTVEEREALMKKVVELHIGVIRARRSSAPPSPHAGKRSSG